MRLSLTGVGVLLIAAAGPLRAQESAAAPVRSSRPVPQIITSAQGEARVTPDRATVYLGVETRSATAALASTGNARRQQAVFDALRRLGIAPDQISTVSYNIQPEQVYHPDKGDTIPRIVGYRVTNMIRVELRRLDQVGAVLDAAVSHGANTVNSLDFYASNPDSARRAALAQAVERARADAEVMARSAGGRLGSLIDLTSGQSISPRPTPMIMAATRMEADVSTPIAAGEQTLTVQVSARWHFVESVK